MNRKLHFVKIASAAVFMFLISANFSFAQNLNFTIDVCGANTPNEVRLVGPIWNNWDPNGGPVGTPNGDGTWNVLITDVLSDDLEFLINVDGTYENLIYAMQNGGTCAPITDYWAYANRSYVLGSTETSFTYNRCSSCEVPNQLTIIAEVCTPTNTNTTAFLKGSPWAWSDEFGLTGVNNNDGTFTFKLTPPQNDTILYLLKIDGVQEDLIPAMINAGTCAPDTDFSTYANRRWTKEDNDTIYITYYDCVSCSASIEEAEFITSKVFPNPSKSGFNITSESMIDKYELVDILGKQIYVASNVLSGNVYVNTDKFEKGMYVLKVYKNNTFESHTVVIE